MSISPTNEQISVLVLDDPGLMRESLRALLSVVPRVQICDMVDFSQMPLDWIMNQHPDCVVFECPDSPPADLSLPVIVRGVKQSLPATRCLIIVHSPNHASAYLAAGADYVLMKGFAFGELKQAFETLFN